MKFKNILVELHEPGIRLIKVSRPDALNALNTQTIEELKTQLTQDAQDSNIRVVVLTGDGDKAFVAGADILEMKDQTQSDAVRFSQHGQAVTKLLELMPKPTIAAVNGYALGGAPS